ncbi:MAG: hypothetical protein HXM71_04770 [Mogibacterium diversum]|jgi:hypothetical protein|uniref:Restriction endonuclease n=1 Tax=Mogibacterium diversum TaxID=114527 RepID=A0A930EH70_9FIRM|nr:hypothetical protein [Candidatus Nanosynbacter sp.]MBF1352414.1 hypothetical protein [Mogibacterium diversum]
MNYLEILEVATKELRKLQGKTLDVIEISKPHNVEYALHLAKVVSKTSPLIGNMIEFAIIEQLNKVDWNGLGKWARQDPGFPDAIFLGKLEPSPGIEIKTWFPLATEITARFKDSALHFDKQQTNVAVVAWLPEHLIYGKPKIIDVWVGSAQSLANARDAHYHNPPDYLVIEPEDTSLRTVNLQQTNTNGYKFQGSRELLTKAQKDVKKWGKSGRAFSTDPEYQDKLKSLFGKYPYRLDTNYAKIDRIAHEGLEDFKKRVLSTKIEEKSILEWTRHDWSTLLEENKKDASGVVKDLI